MMKIAGVRFKENWKVYDFDATGIEIAVGDNVIVDSDRGPGFARVVRLKQENGNTIDADPKAEEPAAGEQESATSPERAPLEAARPDGPKILRKIVRKATEEDIQKEKKNQEREAEASAACQELIAERELPMKLIRVEYSFDASRAIFFFFSESRVDFRELVKDLAYKFKVRVEMRQIGVRDVARLVGGYGPCGRDLCCASFLRNFEPVSIRMAKKQDMVLNPAKISGVCGRLLCCLSYEYEFYDEIKKDIAGLRDKEKKEEERRIADDRREVESRRTAEDKNREEERKRNQERRENQKESGVKGGGKSEKKKDTRPERKPQPDRKPQPEKKPQPDRKPQGSGPRPGEKPQQGKPDQQKDPQQKPAQNPPNEKEGQPKGRRRFWRRRRKKPGGS